MTNADVFIQHYKELEEVVRYVYNLSVVDFISMPFSKSKESRQFRDEIMYCKEVRNLLQHKKKICDNYAIQPSDEMINFISALIEKIKGKQKCCDILIPFSQLYCRTISDFVKPAMIKMRQKSFSHIPIIHEKKVIGVFNASSMFSYVADEEIVEVDDKLKFSDIEKYLDFNTNDLEVFRFERMDIYVDDLQQRFKEEFEKGKRIGMLFITQNGKNGEGILGIITPWDILANNKIMN